MTENEYFRWQDDMEMGGRILANLEAILSDNGSEMSVSALDRSLYKYTECGAHLSVQLHDGTWRHSGNLLGIKNGDVRQLLVGSIVEGSDAEVCAEPIDLIDYEDPDKAVEVFNKTVGWVNDEACALWHEANQDEDEDEDEEGESK